MSTRMTVFSARIALFVVCAATLVLGWVAAGFRVDSSVERLLPVDDPDRAYYQGVRREFGSEEILVAAVFDSNVFTPRALNRIERIVAELSRMEGVRDVEALTTLERIEFNEDGLGRVRLLPPRPWDAAKIKAFRARALAHRIGRKIVVPPQGGATGISIWLEPLADEKFVESGLEGRIRAALGDSGGFALTGLPAIKAEAARKMVADLAIFIPLGIAVVSIVLFWMFRSWRGVLLPLSTVLIGVTCTTGVMTLRGGAFTLGTLVLPPLLMAVGVAYAIHIMSRYYFDLGSGRSRRAVVATTMAHVRLPVAMAALTTLAGFATFIGHPIPTTRDFGVYSSLGITIIFLASVIVIPAALTVLPQPRYRPRSEGWMQAMLDKIAILAVHHSRAVLLVTVAVVLLSLGGIGRIHVETDYLRFFSPKSRVRVENTRVAHALAGTQLLSVVIDGQGPESVTQTRVLRAMGALQRFIDAQAGVDKSVSFLDHLDMVRQAVEPESATQPLTDQAKVDQFILLLNPADTRRTMNVDFSRANVNVYTRLSGSREIRDLVSRVEAFGHDHFPESTQVHVTGTLVLLNRSADALARGQIGGLRIVFAVLLVLMLCLFRSLREGLLSMVPNIVPVIVLFGIMGWLGIDLNIATSMIAAIALGIAVDDTIHYLTGFHEALRSGKSREEAVLETVHTVGRPILITSVALSAGFLVVCFSSFQPIRHFGILASITMSIALMADLLVLPALLVQFRVGTPGPFPHGTGTPPAGTFQGENP